MLILGLVWWLFAIEIIFGGLALFSVGNRRPFLGGFFIGAGLLTWWVFSGFPNVVDIFQTHGQAILFWTVTYLLAGLAWGVINWLIYTRSESSRHEIRSSYALYERNSDNPTVDGFKNSSYYPFGFQKDFPFIANSIIWWPLSLIWTIFDDFLLNVVTFFGRQFSGFFAWLASGSVNSALKDKTKP